MSEFNLEAKQHRAGGYRSAIWPDLLASRTDDRIEITVGADKGYDARESIKACEQLKVTPHVAQNISGRRSAVADTSAASVGYAISQQKRKLIEQDSAHMALWWNLRGTYWYLESNGRYFSELRMALSARHANQQQHRGIGGQ